VSFQFTDRRYWVKISKNPDKFEIILAFMGIIVVYCLFYPPVSDSPHAKGKSLIFAAELISDGDNLSPKCIQVNREKVKTQEIMT
jgi:hypothetical protein